MGLTFAGRVDRLNTGRGGLEKSLDMVIWSYVPLGACLSR